MSAIMLTRLERAVLRNVFWGRLFCDGRTEAGRIATITGCRHALGRLRRYGFVERGAYWLTLAGVEALGESRRLAAAAARGVLR